jgi:hypothetical protein
MILPKPRDRFGAIIQSEGRGGKAPYAWFVWQRGFCGDTATRRLPPVTGS